MVIGLLQGATNHIDQQQTRHEEAAIAPLLAIQAATAMVKHITPYGSNLGNDGLVILRVPATICRERGELDNALVIEKLNVVQVLLPRFCHT